MYFSFYWYPVLCIIVRPRQREPSVSTLRSPFSFQFLRHCVLTYLIKENKVILCFLFTSFVLDFEIQHRKYHMRWAKKYRIILFPYSLILFFISH